MDTATAQAEIQPTPAVLALARALVQDGSQLDDLQRAVFDALKPMLPPNFRTPLYLAIRDRQFISVSGALEFFRAAAEAYGAAADFIEKNHQPLP